jgi:hypothetical protein
MDFSIQMSSILPFRSPVNTVGLSGTSCYLIKGEP